MILNKPMQQHHTMLMMGCHSQYCYKMTQVHLPLAKVQDSHGSPKPCFQNWLAPSRQIFEFWFFHVSKNASSQCNHIHQDNQVSWVQTRTGNSGSSVLLPQKCKHICQTSSRLGYSTVFQPKRWWWLEMQPKQLWPWISHASGIIIVWTITWGAWMTF